MDFRLLGPLEVLDDEGRALPLGGARQRALLALLVLNANERVSVDRLVDALWGERPAQSAVAMVHSYVSRLRKLGIDIARRPGGYELPLDPDRTDVARFNALAEAGRQALAAGDHAAAAEQLSAALKLWRGRPLSDLDGGTALDIDVTRLEEQRLAALEDRIEADLARGRHSAVVAELDELVARHPLRERLRGQLMLALYRSGRQAEALRVYQDGRRRLVEELGLEPGPELQRLHRAVLAQDAGLAARSAAAPAVRADVAPPRAASLRDDRSLFRRALTTAVALTIAALVVGFIVLGEESPDREEPPPQPRSAAPPSDGGVRLPFPSVPERFLGRYRVVPMPSTPPTDRAELLMTIRPRSDPVCTDMFGGDKTCFTLIPAQNPSDPGARGEIAYNKPHVALRYVRIPFDRECEGEIDRYRSVAGDRRLELARRIERRGGPDWLCTFAAFVRR